MKAQTLFWPLLKNELRFGHTLGMGQSAAILLPYWVCAGSLPLLALYRDGIARGNIATLFATGFLPIIVAMLLMGLTTWMPYATIPALPTLFAPPSPIPGAVENAGGLEFLFTRAVDRKILFRARATALFISILAPIFLSILVSPFTHEVRFLPFSDGSVETNQRRSEQYLQAFHPAQPGILPYGAVAYTAWLAASGTAAFLLLQWYYTLIARRVKSSNWWTALYAGAPVFLLPPFFVVTMRDSFRTRFDVFEGSFLFFSGHPLAIIVALVVLAVANQIWCERRFSQLELL